MITIEEFKKVELKVARILEAEKIQGSDKLMRLKVSLGDEERTLVAGIAQQYSPEDLLGKLIVIVANLQPAVFRGVKSEGMILAAQEKDTGKLSLLSLDRPVKEGSLIL